MPDRLRRNCADAESRIGFRRAASLARACPRCAAETSGERGVAPAQRRTYLCDVSVRYIGARHYSIVIKEITSMLVPGAAGSEASMSGQRSGVLELAVLGLLHETPMHGYELRKRLNAVLGAFRAFGYGSLYPCLKGLLASGLIAEDTLPGAPKPLAGRRSKIVYRMTADGKERLQDLLSQAGPAAWEDDGFGVHFAFCGQTRADIRLRILEGRRT